MQSPSSNSPPALRLLEKAVGRPAPMPLPTLRPQAWWQRWLDRVAGIWR